MKTREKGEREEEDRRGTGEKEGVATGQEEKAEELTHQGGQKKGEGEKPEGGWGGRKERDKRKRAPCPGRGGQLHSHRPPQGRCPSAQL